MLADPLQTGLHLLLRHWAAQSGLAGAIIIVAIITKIKFKRIGAYSMSVVAIFILKRCFPFLLNFQIWKF
jgi:hypothetical protein